jgi:hypothetical protein
MAKNSNMDMKGFNEQTSEKVQNALKKNLQGGFRNCIITVNLIKYICQSPAFCLHYSELRMHTYPKYLHDDFPIHAELSTDSYRLISY